VDAHLAQQPADKRVLLLCALASFKDCVAINFFAAPAKLADAGKKLQGEGKTSRMLKVRSAKDIDTASIKRWLKVASQ